MLLPGTAPRRCRGRWQWWQAAKAPQSALLLAALLLAANSSSVRQSQACLSMHIFEAPVDVQVFAHAVVLMHED